MAFYAEGESTLKKVSLSGGQPVPLAGLASSFTGGSWGTDDAIVFSTLATAGLGTVPASGGETTPLTVVSAGSLTHASPYHLPGAHHVLFVITDGVDASGEIAVVSTQSGEVHQLGVRGLSPRYLQGGTTGYLVYGQANDLVAVPFDPESLQMRGVPVSVLSSVHSTPRGAAYAAFTEAGAAFYAETVSLGQRQAVWVDRQGTVSPIDPLATRFGAGLQLSPDSRRLAFSESAPEGPQLVVHDFQTADTFQVTFGTGGNIYPVWSPDGTRLAFASNRAGPVYQLHVLDVDGGGEPMLLLDTTGVSLPISWSSGGETLFYYYYDTGAETGRDIHAYSFSDDRAVPIRPTPADERAPVVSPDGQWIAYLSDESGRFEVYVLSYPDLEVRRQVSRGGAAEPAWSPTGDELYYRSSNQTMMAVAFQATPTLAIGSPQVLFEDAFVREEFLTFAYDVGADGRFLMVTEGGDAETTVNLQVVLGFADEVDRLVSAQQ